MCFMHLACFSCSRNDSSSRVNVAMHREGKSCDLDKCNDRCRRSRLTLCSWCNWRGIGSGTHRRASLALRLTQNEGNRYCPTKPTSAMRHKVAAAQSLIFQGVSMSDDVSLQQKALTRVPKMVEIRRHCWSLSLPVFSRVDIGPARSLGLCSLARLSERCCIIFWNAQADETIDDVVNRNLFAP